MRAEWICKKNDGFLWEAKARYGNKKHIRYKRSKEETFHSYKKVVKHLHNLHGCGIRLNYCYLARVDGAFYLHYLHNLHGFWAISRKNSL